MTQRENDSGDSTTQGQIMTYSVWIASMAHRLGNSTGLIPQLVSEARESLGKRETLLSILSEIEDTARSQLLTIKELRGVSRFSRGSGIGPAAVNRVVRNAVQASSERKKNTRALRLKINLDLDPSLPDVKADEQLLGEVLINLIENAISATRSSPRALVTVKTYVDREGVAIDITDNGEGIKPDLLEHLFKPFFTTKPTGTGLGLYLSKTLAESWGGTVEVGRTDSSGTTVTIWLPSWKARAPGSDKGYALIVEDNATWARRLTQILADRGLSVTVANTASDALRRMQGLEFDLAVVDIHLDTGAHPDRTLSGLDIARHLRSRSPEMTIVVVSGFLEPSLLMEAASVGVDAFLPKENVSREQINEILDKVSLKREVERESLMQSHLNRLTYEMLSMMSHELRAPLLTIQRNVEALAMGALGSLNREQTEAVETMKKAVGREFVMLNAHLDINRIERGDERLVYQETDLVKLLVDEVVAHKSEASDKKVRIRKRLPKKKALVSVDVNRFRVALNPLLDNAIKFSPEGGEVTVGMQLTPGFAEVKISDHGPGINPTEINRLLEGHLPEASGFTQRMRGTGLGLSIAKRLIELHGGKLWISSDGRSGTDVNFQIPIKT